MCYCNEARVCRVVPHARLALVCVACIMPFQAFPICLTTKIQPEMTVWLYQCWEDRWLPHLYEMTVWLRQCWEDRWLPHLYEMTVWLHQCWEDRWLPHLCEMTVWLRQCWEDRWLPHLCEMTVWLCQYMLGGQIATISLVL